MDVERSYMKTVTSRLHFSLLWPSDKLLTKFLFNSFKAILNVVLIDSFVIFTTVKPLRVLSSSWIVIWIISLASDIQPFFRRRNTRTLCQICWKLTVKTPRRHWSCSHAFIVNFEQILYIVLVFLLLVEFIQGNADWVVFLCKIDSFKVTCFQKIFFTEAPSLLLLKNLLIIIFKTWKPQSKCLLHVNLHFVTHKSHFLALGAELYQFSVPPNLNCKWKTCKFCLIWGLYR